MPPTGISIVIPTLNEASSLPLALDSCRAQGADDIIVADGGSTDGTLAVATEYRARIVTVSPPSRASQMNAGASHSCNNILVFLHADTRLDHGALDALRATISDGRIVGGGFHRHYQTASSLLAASSHIGNARARLTGWYFGDQAIWVRREAFNRLGGYPEVSRFEDLDLTRKLRRLGPTRLVTPGVTTSDRRFRDGALLRVIKDIFLTVHHVCLDPAP